MNPRAIFVNRESGALVEVRNVGASFVEIVVLGVLGGRWSMPITQYDGGTFTSQFRPATAADLSTLGGEGFRLPADAPEEWLAMMAPAGDGAAEKTP